MTFRSSPTISPQTSSRSRGGSKGDGGDGRIRSETNHHVRVNADAENLACLPVEEGDEAIDIKLLPSPSPPSRQEMLEHNLTHWPFRSWCKHCVAGKAKATKHSQSGATAASEVPVISMDYAFMGDKDNEDTEAKAMDAEADFEFNDADESKSKILVIRDSKSRVCTAIPVPRKGADNEEWNLKESLRFLEFLGYSNIVLKSDQERALSSLIRKIRTHRGDQTQTM